MHDHEQASALEQQVGQIDWSWEPAILLGLALLAAGYWWTCRWLERQNGQRAGGWRVASFYAGVLTLFLALASPIAQIGEHYLASVHMAQHLLLTMVAVPLLMLGTPYWMLRPLFSTQTLLKAGGFLTNPFIAYALYNGVFILWHLPALYDEALHDSPMHSFEHLSFMATAVLGWWPVISPSPLLPSLPYPSRTLYLVLQNLPQVLLSALLVFAPTPLYPTYARAPRLWGVSPLLDQQVAGLIMWVPGGLVYLLALTIVFFAWFRQEKGSGEILDPRPNPMSTEEKNG